MADDEKPETPRNEAGQFIQGLSGNPAGRPKGARTKLGEQFLEDMQAAWEAGGAAVITQVMAEKPDAFLKVVASLMPKDFNLNVNQVDGMTDDELIQRIRRLDTAIRPFLDIERTGGVDGGTGPASTH